jgi:hypothetical protein
LGTGFFSVCGHKSNFADAKFARDPASRPRANARQRSGFHSARNSPQAMPHRAGGREFFCCGHKSNFADAKFARDPASRFRLLAEHRSGFHHTKKHAAGDASSCRRA